MKKRLVVIGNGMAGMRTVEEVLEANPNAYNITVFGAEPYGNYNRIMLSPVLSGEKTVEDIMINDRQWYKDNDITLHAGESKAVVAIDRKHKIVTTQDGTEAPYDKLLIATGSNPFVLPVPGHELDGVISFRGIFDVNTMLQYTKTHRHAVVLGGGLLGLEAANGLRQRGMHVTVLHNSDILLNRQLDRTAAVMLQDELEGRGIHFKMQAKTESLEGNEHGHVRAVKFADGTELPCDLFVMAIGVRPNQTLAQSAGLHCERGIVVNDTLQTFDPSIYAVGECVQHRGQTFGLVAPVFDQAKVCANHLCQHGVAEYKTLPSATKLKVSGIHLFSVGEFNGDDDCQFQHFHDPKLQVYKRLVFRGQRLVGAVVYGNTIDGGWYQQLVEQETNVSHFRTVMIFGQAYANAVTEQLTESNVSTTSQMEVA
ncbi:NAD(P)/FAD-dependent oxidoreductase [Echinimonas agarilytica]|uniref:FAD-dependent oxidoreductase n=1 Tax=Echinimonas agarilytica TaxID=1215918 RepID=A0AA42B7H9_9GAMM|nr:FAD-dependent oxidoreductase [Echinimonas agarilytica]MCM2679313.1 FAD-dependent oxidoreductase [Echinimonas agarilytica]